MNGRTVSEITETMAHITQVDLPDLIDEGEDPVAIYEQLKELQEVLSSSMNLVGGVAGMPFQERLVL